MEKTWTPTEPLSSQEIDLIEELANKVLAPETDLKLQPDDAHYMWSKARNALNHFMDPARCLRIVNELRQKG